MKAGYKPGSTTGEKKEGAEEALYGYKAKRRTASNVVCFRKNFWRV